MIGGFCFSGCKSLCGVTFESGSELKEIDESAFSWCAIDSLRIPRNVEMIVNLFVKLIDNELLEDILLVRRSGELAECWRFRWSVPSREKFLLPYFSPIAVNTGMHQIKLDFER
jgi:hypothetical protein